jgi:hypothetical protein
MTYYRHVMSGPNPGGDIWNAGVHSNSAQNLAAVHGQFVTSITSFWSATVEAIFPAGERVTQLQTNQLDPVTGKNVAQANTSVTFVGTGAGSAMPPRVALVVSLRTALPTRSGRGRLYLPAPIASACDANGQLTAANATLLSTNFAAFCTGMTTICPVVVYHSATKTGTVVSTVLVGTVLGTQRRRTNKIVSSYSSHVV